MNTTAKTHPHRSFVTAILHSLTHRSADAEQVLAPHVVKTYSMIAPRLF